MTALMLYCKSYRNDVLRARKLVESVSDFNEEHIPFVISVPSRDVSLFRDHLSGCTVELITDEEILKANSAFDPEKILALRGGISQQIIKSEFWRLGYSETYVCIDSDCFFIRPFGVSDFLAPEGHPYTVMHESKELLQFAVNNDLQQIYDLFHSEHATLMGIFEREGRAFDFGPPPMIWSARVWQALDEQFLQPRAMNFCDAIELFPAEIQWYGEAMLKFRPFRLMPVEPLFKFYHYEDQYLQGRQAGDTIERLAKNFLGICYQSNWDKAVDFSGKRKPFPSRVWRQFRKKVLGRRI